MSTENKILECKCGWKGIPLEEYSFIPSDKFTLYTKRLRCKKCDSELIVESREVDKVSDVQEISLPVKEMPLPYTFLTDKFKLEIKADEFLISDLNDNFPHSKPPYLFKAECKVECYGEVFYEAVLKMENGFNLEFRIPEKEVDSFCEFLLKHYEMETRQPHSTPPKLP